MEEKLKEVIAVNLKVRCCPLPPLMANCYIVKAESGEAFVVDPGSFNGRLKKSLDEEGITELKYILLTHGHYDHIMGAEKLRENYGGKICVHENDAPCLSDPEKSRVLFRNFLMPPFEQDIALRDKATLPFGEGEIEVLHTPGHTVGCVCYKVGDCLFTGDTLFHLCVGRTDFPGGSEREMLFSMKKLKALEGDYKVYPGHEESTTLSYEKAYNPYMKGI